MLHFQVQTQRSLIVALTPGLDRLLQDYVQRNKTHLERWEPPRSAHYFTLKGTQQRIHDYLLQASQGQILPLVALDQKRESIIATVNVSNIVRGIFQSAYLGYGLDEQYQGQGIMTEILTAAIPAIFNGLKLHRLMANYIPSNLRSGRLLKRVGFVEEGFARDYLFIDGKWQDHILMSRINPSFHF
ncbi:GNAT family N-acetyltransferase [Celerinatantimonas sp. YJH-8]|uniref:GNAT family N-acetyltransferase n=1 Tax=Celerinatantimonas sp. YJH-8 TaxID=3228714 RepID=UPI0038C3E2D4